MDTSDPEIAFDADGNCNHCNKALELAPITWFPGEKGNKMLNEIASKVKEEQKKKEFDCIIGLSGGVDSSYLAYITKVRLGLRPLVVHVDCGWNSEMAVKNIENITKHLNIELHTFVVNWEAMKDLQRAFFKASVMDQDIPQDHAIFAALYKFAEDNNIKYALNGLNYTSEIIMPSSWGFQAMDLRHLRSVHKQFGEKEFKDYPTIGFFRRYIYYSLIKNIKIISPLNYLNYRKDEAVALMEKELGWHYYAGKHHESRFTKFYQCYYLPHKFGFEKKRAHLSSLIISGQMTRDEALNQMDRSDYSEAEMNDDLEYVAKKLDWSPSEFRAIIDQPARNHSEFASNKFLFSFGLKTKRYLKKILGRT
jgi:N-acetyl sugar amidotransferase